MTWRAGMLLRGGRRRVLYTENDAAWVGKNRFAIPPEVEMGDSGAEAWANLRGAMTSSKKANQNGNV